MPGGLMLTPKFPDLNMHEHYDANMKTCEIVLLALISWALCEEASFAVAQSVSDYAVRVSATVQTNPPQITLSWPGDSNATGYGVYRKLRDATSWGAGVMLAANATNFVDTNVVVGIFQGIDDILSYARLIAGPN